MLIIFVNTSSPPLQEKLLQMQQQASGQVTTFLYLRKTTKQKGNLRHWLKSCHLTVPLSQQALMMKA